MGHLVEQGAVERFPVLELPLFRHYDFILRNGIVRTILMHGPYGTDPQVLAYHPVHRLEVELFACLDFRTAVFLFQLFPQFRTRFPQVGLLYVEHPENLHPRIDIVLLLLILGEILVVVILDFLLRLLVYAGESGEHHREGFLAAQHGDPRQFLSVLSRLVHPLHAVEGTEAGYFVSLFLAVQHQHEGVHAVVFASGQVARPLQCAFREPGLAPVLIDAFYLFNHHLGEQVESLFLAVRPVRVLSSVTGHIRHLLSLPASGTYWLSSSTRHEMSGLPSYSERDISPFASTLTPGCSHSSFSLPKQKKRTH